jgi:hypothetical protein
MWVSRWLSGNIIITDECMDCLLKSLLKRVPSSIPVNVKTRGNEERGNSTKLYKLNTTVFFSLFERQLWGCALSCSLATPKSQTHLKLGEVSLRRSYPHEGFLVPLHFTWPNWIKYWIHFTHTPNLPNLALWPNYINLNLLCKNLPTLIWKSHLLNIFSITS